MLMRKCLLAMLILMLVILMLILMLLNLNTSFADTDADFRIRSMSLCCNDILWNLIVSNKMLKSWNSVKESAECVYILLSIDELWLFLSKCWRVEIQLKNQQSVYIFFCQWMNFLNRIRKKSQLWSVDWLKILFPPINTHSKNVCFFLNTLNQLCRWKFIFSFTDPPTLFFPTL